MMMKVQCDSCGTRYKLDESRIKGKGARITCPKCGHVFVVYRTPTDFDDEEPATIVADRGVLFPKGMASEARLGSGSGGASMDEGAATIVDMKAATRPNMGQTQDMASGKPVIERPKTATELVWREVGLSSFKVKVSFGMVYDFSDVAVLSKYLAEKKVQPTDLLSFDGKSWEPINELGDLDTFFIDTWVAMKTAKMAGDSSTALKLGNTTGPGAEVATPTPQKTPQSSFLPPAPADVAFEDQTIAMPSGLNTPSKPSGPPVSDGGLFGDALFDGMPEAGQLSPPPRLVHHKTQRADPNPVPAAKSPTRKAASPKVSPGQAGILVALLLLAGVLGWLYFQEMGNQTAPPQTVAAAKQKAQMDSVVSVLYPSLSSASAVQGDAPAPPPENPEKVDATKGADGVEPAEKEATAPTVKARAKSGKRSARKNTGKKGVTVSSISAADYVELGDAQMSAKNYKTAVQSYRKAVAAKPNNGSYLVKLGLAQVRAGSPTEGSKSLERGLKKNPKLIDAHKWLGEAYARLGRNQAARDSYQRYLKARPKAGDRKEIEAKVAALS